MGAQCDALRCDMAMLMTNEVFARTWHERTAPDGGLLAVRDRAASRRRYPDLVLIAEAYWDMEWTLQQQGFDYCYDKRLYDRLVHEGADAVRGHLSGDAGLPGAPAAVHREPRRAARRGHVRERARRGPPPSSPRRCRARGCSTTASSTATASHIPVFLGRGPEEAPDEDLRAFYDRLLHAVRDSGLRNGDWRLCDCTGWPDNDSHRQLVAWCWEAPPRGRQPRRRPGAGAASTCRGTTSPATTGT